MLGFGATGQFAIGQVGTTGTAAENITPDKWYQELSMPPRQRLGLRPGAQQFAALPDPLPFVSFSWFQELTLPSVRTRTGLRPGAQQFVAADMAVIPVSRMVPWFVPLSEPVRTRTGLRPAAQQFAAADTTVIPIGRMTPWFVPLAEPVRKRPGLDAARQQFLAAPSQLRPNPTVSGIWASLETKDTFLAGAQAWNRINSAEMGIIVNNAPLAEMGVSQTQGGLTAKMSISII